MEAGCDEHPADKRPVRYRKIFVQVFLSRRYKVKIHETIAFNFHLITLLFVNEKRSDSGKRLQCMITNNGYIMFIKTLSTCCNGIHFLSIF